MELISERRVVLSNICGSLSLACWILLLLPQLLEQWRVKSADGIAIGFILAWSFGDIANLVGSIMDQLRPSVVFVALWFCFSDTLLLVSYWYYKRQPTSSKLTTTSPRRSVAPSNIESNNHRNDSQVTSPTATVHTPLLQETYEPESDTVSDMALAAESRRDFMLGTFLPAVFVIVVATLSYFISDASDPSAEEPANSASAEVLGYVSAALYLLARVPQIVQNHHRRSVEGLSMGFFTLSILGNLTYAGQVVLFRSDGPWLITYLPWLIGSLGTIAEDVVILLQFHTYRKFSRS